jgi:hypothetical protein
MAEHLTVTVDAAARADTERAEEAARAHVFAANSAGGRATVASHGPQLANGGKASTGGSATVASHGPQMAHGGESTTGVLKPQLSVDKLKDPKKHTASHSRSPQVCKWGCGAKASSKNLMAQHYRRVIKAHQTPGAKIPCNCPGP